MLCPSFWEITALLKLNYDAKNTYAGSWKLHEVLDKNIRYWVYNWKYKVKYLKSYNPPINPIQQLNLISGRSIFNEIKNIILIYFKDSLPCK